VALERLGRREEARAEYQKALASFLRYPDLNAEALTDAVTAWRKHGLSDASKDGNLEALRLGRNSAATYSKRGVALGKAGEFDAAIVVLREAIPRDPHDPRSPYELGNVLRSVNRPAEAITAYREAVRLNVPDPEAYLRLAILLSDRGEYTAALGMLEQGARADPRWLDDPRTFLRYKSACCATLAATGRGKDPSPPADRPVLRRKALDWLRADLAAWEKILAANPGSATELEKALARWLVDPDLAVMRPGLARDGIPADERSAWDALWAGVRSAIATARTRPPTEAAPLPGSAGR
jgi:tetratricopeptide (TPR) repeat protein